MKKYTTADRLKEIMYTRGLKQVDILEKCKPFCEKYGVKLNRNDLSQYVSGKVVPRQDKLSVLGSALGVSEVWLMGYDEPADPVGISETFATDPEEAELINNYRALNAEGKRKLVERSRELVALGYKRGSLPEASSDMA